jgi:hypothetical protein
LQELKHAQSALGVWHVQQVSRLALGIFGSPSCRTVVWTFACPAIFATVAMSTPASSRSLL